ncbi:23S rRNA (guanosine(2251)-2'-O)-methyltransferase RlmB [Blochmannia endosymbiont of Camponotus sp. C-003]|uniref:23S rRNA (guanosine(2251)-2'-O)-methyltransferase RlmB n=1 Tax=unclassified Candidatus Blochmanniella TaxID=711328 RepID=UPI0020256101|nr:MULTISPECIES: 23S rRNA (guanosine(2251)-2'-O)-methyltransferase RlmB [unclassified Candidatus Blochmannia]URJ23150.1 23S rRNA (guanosine(2251)-2'-O)-methyltransferase RlmB [Blochmannia endosymbiont of Camponotus sp. C-003]URJ28619.1 23S rRNA (guanosine(2251)-2'-O)-methyltransferase RlmB [Blochmannia endosymbiont of Camponotus sp. C-046]
MSELVYGIHSVKSVLDNYSQRILSVCIMHKSKDLRLKLLIDQIKQCKISIQECSRRQLDIQARGALHQGIIAKIVTNCCMQENDLPNFLMKCKTTPLLVVLDGVTDPHNLGACLRSADAAGAHIVIAPRNRSARLNGTVRKVASGSVDNVPFMQVTNLIRTLRLLQKYNIWIIGTVIKSQHLIFNSKLIRPLAFVMGSEGDGIRYLTQKNCDELITIPMLGVATSLNVSVATGICLFEALRQRNQYK